MRVLTLLVAFALCSCESASEQGQFHGYPCTQDCSGHKAGYEWAGRKGIIDPENCRGNSQSFIEGCKAYANEHR